MVGMAALFEPIVPVLFYFYPWQVILVAVLVLAHSFGVSLLCHFGFRRDWLNLAHILFGLKFISALGMAYLLWSQGKTPIGLAALAWPLLGPVEGYVTLIPQVILEVLGLAKLRRSVRSKRDFWRLLGCNISGQRALRPCITQISH